MWLKGKSSVDEMKKFIEREADIKKEGKM